MPELPEVQAHAERLTAIHAGRRLARFVPLTFTALKTVTPSPDEAKGLPLLDVGRRGKYLLARFEPLTFIVHLMQGGRLSEDVKQSMKPRGGQARFVFDDDGPALLLTEQGTERKAGVWCVLPGEALTSPPLDRLGPEADRIEPDELAALFAERSVRLQGSCATNGRSPGSAVAWRTRVPSGQALAVRDDRQARVAGATTVGGAIRDAVAEGLEYERGRDDMSSSKDRPGRVTTAGEPCPVCGDTIRAVEYSGYTVNYCPTCQTAGKILADNTTSKFLK